MEKCNQIVNFKEKIKKQSIFENKQKNAFNPSNDNNNKDTILNKITKNFNEDLNVKTPFKSKSKRKLIFRNKKYYYSAI